MERHIPFILGAVLIYALSILAYTIAKLLRPAQNKVSIQPEIINRSILTFGFRTFFIVISVLFAGFIFFIPIASVFKNFMTTSEKWKIFIITISFLSIIVLGTWNAISKNDLDWQGKAEK